MPDTRSVLEGRQPVGANEELRLAIKTKPAAVSAGAVIVTDETAGGEDVTAATTSGSASVQAGKLLLPVLQNLTPGHLYRVAVQYSDGTSPVIEIYIEVEAER